MMSILADYQGVMEKGNGLLVIFGLKIATCGTVRYDF
jgi:hypothetical protein